jgi:hypothetical protein
VSPDNCEFELPDPGDPTTPFPFEPPSADWPEPLPRDLSDFRRWCERRVTDLRRLPLSLGLDASIFGGKAAHDAWLFATSFGIQVPKPPGLMAPRAALEFLAVCMGRCAEQIGPVFPDLTQGSPQAAKPQRVVERTDATDEDTTIPSEQRTRPLGIAEAARLMGYKGARKKAGQSLRLAMDVGAVKYVKLTRQNYIFDRRDFPAEAHPKLAPTGPK